MTLEQEAEEAVDAELRADKSFNYVKHPDERKIMELYAAAASRELRLRKIAVEAESAPWFAHESSLRGLIQRILTLAKGKP